MCSVLHKINVLVCFAAPLNTWKSIDLRQSNPQIFLHRCWQSGQGEFWPLAGCGVNAQLPSGRCYRALSTRTARQRKQFLPLSNPSHEHLTIIVTHTIYTLIYLTTYLVYTSIAHNIPVHTKLSISYIPVHTNCRFVYCYSLFTCCFLILIYVVYSVTVILLHCNSFCHGNKFLEYVNIPGNKVNSDSDQTVWEMILIPYSPCSELFSQMVEKFFFCLLGRDVTINREPVVNQLKHVTI